MANTLIQIKKSTANSVPTSLVSAELGYSFVSDKLFIGTADGDNVIAIAGKYFVDRQNTILTIANAAFDRANLEPDAAVSNAWTNTVFGYSNTYANNVGTAANGWSNTVVAGANAWVNTSVVGANAYTNTVFGYSNTYTNTVGAASNARANTVSVSANAWANTVGVNVTAVANAWTNTVFGYSNTYTDTVGAASNGWSNTIAVAANAYTNTVFGYSNTYTNTVGAASNGYANTIAVAANAWANTIAVSSNAYTNTVFGYSNTYTNTVGTASNGWANTVVAGANAWSNTKVSSVSGTANQIYSSSGTTPTLNLISTGVVSNTYGGASSIPVINIDAYGRITSASNVVVQGMDYAYANAVGVGANAYTNTIFGYSNTYTDTVGAASNGYANTLAVSSNAWANTVGVNVTAVANAWTNTVFGYSNSYTNTVGAASNGWANTVVAGANGWANTVGVNVTAVANAWTNTVFGYSNTYTNAVGAASNGWANTVTVGANAWANIVFGYSNTYTNTVGAASNDWTNTSLVGANSWTNTQTGIIFSASNTAQYTANLAFNTANVKARIFVQNTSPTLPNINDVWIDSSTGIEYTYINNNANGNTFVEFGPYFSPLNNVTQNLLFNDQTMYTANAAEDLTIQQTGSNGSINLSAAYVKVNQNLFAQTVSIFNSTFPAINAAVTITGSATLYHQPATNDGYMLHITGKDDVATRIIIDSFANANGALVYPIIAGRQARGNVNYPQAVMTNDILNRWSGNGYDGTSYASLGSGRIDIVATENHTTTNKGTQIQFYTMGIGSNVHSNIASFSGTQAIFNGVINPQKGFIYSTRMVANATSLVIDFANDSSVVCRINSDITVSFTNYVVGKVVYLWITNVAGQTKQVTHGVSALNATNHGTSKNIPATSSIYFKYFSNNNNLGNTFVAITQG